MKKRVTALSKMLLSLLIAALGYQVFPSRSNAAESVTISKDVTYQMMDGFGATSTPQVSSLMDNYSTTDQQAILDFLFDSSGLDLSLIRLQVGSYQQGSTPDLETIEPSAGVWDFNTDAATKWLVGKAKFRGVYRYYALPWSPPAWMKTGGGSASGSSIGGTLSTDMYGTFAKYLEKYVLHYTNVDEIPITWIGIQNEPDTDGPHWPTSAYTASEYNTLFNTVKDDFSAQGIPTRFQAPEGAQQAFSDSVLSAMDSTTLSKVDGITTHHYDTDPVNSNLFTYGKSVWMSENADPGSTDNITDGVNWGKDIRNWIAGGASAYLMFRLVGVDDTGRALVSLNSADWSYTFPKRAYVFGQFSSFVRPGYERIDSTSSLTNLKQIAFKDPTNNKAVIVVINNNTTTDSTVDVSGLTASTATIYRTSATENLAQLSNNQPISGGSFTYTFPASSVTTIVENIDEPATAPAAITDLAVSNERAGLKLSWTATGKSGTIGDANKYDIRMSTSPITSANFGSATMLHGVPAPLHAGTKQAHLITNLSPNTTYYFAIKAVREDGVTSPISNVPSITAGLVTDTLDNWDKTFSHTANWDFYTANPDRFDGDGSRVGRTTDTAENIVYNYSNIQSFSADIGCYTTSISGKVKFYTSPDNINWTELATANSTLTATTEGWYKTTFTPAGSIPSGTNYFKIEFSNDANVWSPQLSQITLTYAPQE